MAEGTVAADQLRLFIERIERLEEEKKGIADDVRDVYAEAKANGYDTKIMRDDRPPAEDGDAHPPGSGRAARDLSPRRSGWRKELPWPAIPNIKNIMYRKGAQDKKRSAMFSKLSREITVAAKMGLPDPDMNARLRAAVIAAKAQSMPKDNIQRSIDKASARRRRELRGDPLRGLRPRRRRADRRGADRQPQPHRDQRPHRLLQERRQSRRQRQRQPRLRAAGPDRISGQRRRCRQGARSGDRGRRRGRRIATRTATSIWTSVDSLHEVARALEAAARRGRRRQARLEARDRGRGPRRRRRAR